MKIKEIFWAIWKCIADGFYAFVICLFLFAGGVTHGSDYEIAKAPAVMALFISAVIFFSFFYHVWVIRKRNHAVFEVKKCQLELE